MRSLYKSLVVSRYGFTVSSYWHRLPPRQRALKRQKMNSFLSIAVKVSKDSSCWTRRHFLNASATRNPSWYSSKHFAISRFWRTISGIRKRYDGAPSDQRNPSLLQCGTVQCTRQRQQVQELTMNHFGALWSRDEKTSLLKIGEDRKSTDTGRTRSASRKTAPGYPTWTKTAWLAENREILSLRR